MNPMLYKNDCRLRGKNDNFLESRSANANAELILTNQRLVLIRKAKKIFAKAPAEVEIFPIGEIKIYNDVPQIKQDGSCVEVFFTSGEKTVDLFSKNEARKFINKAVELLTGKTAATRVSDKVKGAIGLVDDTIGINTVDTLKSVTENGLVGAAFGRFGKNSRNRSIGPGAITEVLGATKDLLSKDTSEPTPAVESSTSINNQVETLKKLKDLLDAGVITQEEFETKKKQVLGI